ncbi:MAG: coagulation factor 5/8 type domain-containing protein [Cyanobacteriota bacterium]
MAFPAMLRLVITTSLSIFGISALSLLPLNAKAQSVILSPVSATASTTTPGGYEIGNTIDQSGLSAGFTSGVTSFNTYIAGNPTHTTVAANFEWFGASSTNSAVVDYDLGAIYQIDKMALWNEESSGIGLFDLLASVDGTTYASVLSAIAPPDNPLPPGSYGASIYGFTAVDARYFRLNLSNCPQPIPGNYPSCAIGEVAFSAVPGPLPALGAAVGFGYARRMRKRIQAAS